jgi:hypothetical protein
VGPGRQREGDASWVELFARRESREAGLLALADRWAGWMRGGRGELARAVGCGPSGREVGRLRGKQLGRGEREKRAGPGLS